LDGSLEVLTMNGFPDFMKNPANLISTKSQFSPGIEGYVFDGADGSQMAFWECCIDGVSSEHVHEYDEYITVVQGCYFLIVGNGEIPIMRWQEHHIAKGVVHSGRYLAGTRRIHAFGGRRAEREMKHEVIRIPGVKTADLPFNHVVRAGDILYLTSQISCDLQTGLVIPGDLAAQTRRAMENIKHLLSNSGSSMEHVLRVRVYMRNVSEFGEMNRVYREYFKENKEPARVTVQASSPIEGIDIEIEVTATTK
jgi:reactive intermediate/imine deaminase